MEQGLVPMMSLDREGESRNHERSKTETFAWIMRPEGGKIRGRIYADGSMLDGPFLPIRTTGFGIAAVGEKARYWTTGMAVPRIGATLLLRLRPGR